MTPEDARKYIQNFKYVLAGEAKYVRLNSGREIYFDNMSDEDAVLVAAGLQQMEIAASSGTKGLQ